MPALLAEQDVEARVTQHRLEDEQRAVEHQLHHARPVLHHQYQYAAHHSGDDRLAKAAVQQGKGHGQFGHGVREGFAAVLDVEHEQMRHGKGKREDDQRPPPRWVECHGEVFISLRQQQRSHQQCRRHHHHFVRRGAGTPERLFHGQTQPAFVQW